MEKELSPSARQILQLIPAFQATNMYPPTVRDLAAATGLAVATTWYHLDVLRKQGYIAWETGQFRTLHVVPASDER